MKSAQVSGFNFYLIIGQLQAIAFKYNTFSSNFVRIQRCNTKNCKKSWKFLLAYIKAQNKG